MCATKRLTRSSNAHYDYRRLGSATFLPTHQIAPDIDNERDYVAMSLEQSGMVGKAMTIQFVPPEYGHNLAGDVFFTYGKAIILWLH